MSNLRVLKHPEKLFAWLLRFRVVSNLRVLQALEMAEKHISIKKNDKLIDNLVVVSGDSFIKIK